MPRFAEKFDMACLTVSIYCLKKYASSFRSPGFVIACLAVLLTLEGCSPSSKKEKKVSHQVTLEMDDSYGKAMAMGRIDNKNIDETSGLVVHRGNPYFLWTHNDSGDDARIFLIQKNGHARAEYHLQGATNHDWEDIAVGPGPHPDATYLYIGDIGDNFGLYSGYVIYRLKQPKAPTGPDKGHRSDTLAGVDNLRFVYPDGSHDAETLFIDPSTRDLYIVTRQETQDRVYRYPYPQSTAKTDTVEFVCKLPFNQFAGGDLSADGQTLLLKTLPRVFIWQRKPRQSIADLLSEKPKELPYGTGPQEEGIAIGPRGNGYYTLSESQGKPATLYYHPAKRKNNE